MECRGCHKPIDDSLNYCETCAAKMEVSGSGITKAPKSRKRLNNRLFIITLITMLIVSTAMVFAIVNQSGVNRVGLGTIVNLLGKKLTTTTTFNIVTTIENPENLEIFGDLIGYYQEFDRELVIGTNGKDSGYFAYQESVGETPVFSQVITTDNENCYLSFPELLGKAYYVPIEQGGQSQVLITKYQKMIDYTGLMKTDSYKIFKQQLETIAKSKGDKVTLTFDQEQLGEISLVLLKEMEEDEALMMVVKENAIEIFEEMLEDDFEYELGEFEIDRRFIKDAIEYLEDDFDRDWDDGIREIRQELKKEIDQDKSGVKYDVEVEYTFNFWGRIEAVASEVVFRVKGERIRLKSNTVYAYIYEDPIAELDLVEYEGLSYEEKIESIEDLGDAYIKQDILIDYISPKGTIREGTLQADTHVKLIGLLGHVFLDIQDGDLSRDIEGMVGELFEQWLSDYLVF